MTNWYEREPEANEDPAKLGRRSFLQLLVMGGGVAALGVLGLRLNLFSEGEEAGNLAWINDQEVFPRGWFNRKNWLEKQADWLAVVIDEPVPLEMYARALKEVAGMPVAGNLVVERRGEILLWEGLVVGPEVLAPEYSQLQTQDKVYVGPVANTDPVVGHIFRAFNKGQLQRYRQVRVWPGSGGQYIQAYSSSRSQLSEAELSEWRFNLDAGEWERKFMRRGLPTWESVTDILEGD
jgi:hypothetical protein